MPFPSSTHGHKSSVVRTFVGRWQTSLVVLVLGIVFLTPFVAYGVPAAIGAESSFVVQSGDVYPALNTGDVVFVYQVDPTTVDAGDVIVAHSVSGGIPAIHRVTEVVRSKDTPGEMAYRVIDPGLDPEPRVLRSSEVVGVVPTPSLPGVGQVLFRIPYLGHVYTFFTTTTGFLLLFVTPLFLLMANGSRRIASEIGPVEWPTNIPFGSHQQDPLAYPAAGESNGLSAGVIQGNVSDGNGPSLPFSTAVIGTVTLYTTVVALTEATVWSVTAAVLSFGGLCIVIWLRYLPISPVGSGVTVNGNRMNAASPARGSGESIDGNGFVAIHGNRSFSHDIVIVDLRVAGVVLALITLYAITVSISEPTVWTIAAVVVFLGSLLITLGLRHMVFQPASG